jgi:hypothetical protein
MSKTPNSVDAEVSPSTEIIVKKSVVVGLPTVAAMKSGFANAAGRPGFKAKTSKATGAKKRVRQ